MYLYPFEDARIHAENGIAIALAAPVAAMVINAIASARPERRAGDSVSV